MICAGTDLRLLPAICTDEMTRSVVVVSCHVMSCLNCQTSFVWLVARRWTSSFGPVYHPNTCDQSIPRTVASLGPETVHKLLLQCPH